VDIGVIERSTSLPLNAGKATKTCLPGDKEEVLYLLLMVQKSGESPVAMVNLSHHLQGFRNIPGGCLGFLNHQQYQYLSAISWASKCQCHKIIPAWLDDSRTTTGMFNQFEDN